MTYNKEFLIAIFTPYNVSTMGRKDGSVVSICEALLLKVLLMKLQNKKNLGCDLVEVRIPLFVDLSFGEWSKRYGTGEEMLNCLDFIDAI